MNLVDAGSIEELEDLERRQLTKEDKNLCQAVVQDFLNGKLLDPVLAGLFKSSENEWSRLSSTDLL